ncbi:uncharacterized protein SPSK_10421 [Sporothrix schenckii 1099-18]|uniref:Uncharacterized protein n=1 Tax=Sporothrix schenckii 1099-18 TaxID=1397361 RepID=A0A0F2MFH0_SPOSC|nr:uncharacterized protein SPSK_10421 [Sporothrix schenckii 1099-18]KJR86916.1 hypothetical protein SPSK_10421 [Sporothrix schenckii 1099-18]
MDNRTEYLARLSRKLTIGSLHIRHNDEWRRWVRIRDVRAICGRMLLLDRSGSEAAELDDMGGWFRVVRLEPCCGSAPNTAFAENIVIFDKGQLEKYVRDPWGREGRAWTVGQTFEIKILRQAIFSLFGGVKGGGDHPNAEEVELRTWWMVVAGALLGPHICQSLAKKLANIDKTGGDERWNSHGKERRAWKEGVGKSDCLGGRRALALSDAEA